jgi:hypothetical protein
MNRHPFRAAMLKPQVPQDMIPGFLAISGFHTVAPFRGGMQTSLHTRQVISAAFGPDSFVRIPDCSYRGKDFPHSG